MFVHGFAVSIDWETHQLNYETEMTSMSNGGPRLRVAFESRWITKDRSAQIFMSRSFIVLFVQQTFFAFLFNYFKRYSKGDSPFHKVGKVGVEALLERFPIAFFHLTPTGLGNC